VASQQIRPELVAGRWSLAPLDQATDELGRRVDTLSVPTTPAGYQDLLAWARRLGEPIAWGVDGAGILLGSDGRSLGRASDRMGMSAGPFTAAGRLWLVDVGGVLRTNAPGGVAAAASWPARRYGSVPGGATAWRSSRPAGPTDSPAAIVRTRGR
jgi:hypothetical protein